MSKINWDVYAKRRRINFRKLVERQRIRSYEDYVNYCNSVDVNPLTPAEFQAQSPSDSKPTRSTKPAPAKAASSKPTAEKQDTSAPGPEKPAEVKDADRWGLTPKKSKSQPKKTARKSSK